VLRLYPNPSRWHSTRRLRLALAGLCLAGLVAVLYGWRIGQGLSSFPSYCDLLTRVHP
jgi:hypothetical protein